MPAQSAPSADPWWKHAVIYEIYPRSFQDSNGDGVGDLNGITSRLDYLQKLGVDAIWIAPMYPSPQVDFGYDVSNYDAVDPEYGTMADMDHLIAKGNEHHIRVILDMVLNHTSDKHAWFIASSSSRANPKHNWYVWNDGIPANSPGVTAYQKKYEHEGRVPPNNWISLFGGSAWEWVPAVHQFYYHKFYKQQPDLNWRNPAVEKACFDALRFWLNKASPASASMPFQRCLKMNNCATSPNLAASTHRATPTSATSTQTCCPRCTTCSAACASSPTAIPATASSLAKPICPIRANSSNGMAQIMTSCISPWTCWLASIPEGGGPSTPNVKLNADRLRTTIGEMQTQLGANWPLLVFDNHDNERSWDRFGDGLHNAQIAKIISTLLLTTRATALMYYGEEIGMVTSTPTRKEDVKDPIGITGWPWEKGRDGERTPMQWTPSPQAGFSTNPHTWLPIPPSYKTTNVESESADPDSQLRWFKALVALRRSNAALHGGSMTMLNAGNHDIVAYARSAADGSGVVVAVNCSNQPHTIDLDIASTGIKGSHITTLVSSDPALNEADSLKHVTLAPFASWVAEVR